MDVRVYGATHCTSSWTQLPMQTPAGWAEAGQGQTVDDTSMVRREIKCQMLGGGVSGVKAGW